MLDNGEYLCAFELTGYIFTEVGSIEMDDSGGEKEMMADSCTEIWVGILRRMKKIEGGEKKVKEIVEFWKREYKGRSAMIEELKKL